MSEQQSATTRACPICGGDAKKLLFRQRFEAMSRGSLLETYDVVVCNDCGLGFADGLPEQAMFDVYYREMSKYEHQHRKGRESEYILARLGATARTITQLMPNRQTRVLDVGCSTGHLLHLLKQSGYEHVVGLDPSPMCAEAAARLYGVRVMTATLATIPESRGRADLVVLSHVLEHIRDLKSVIGQMQGLLSDRGYVFIRVPDAASFARWPDAPFQQFSTEHINFFSMTSLCNLMQVHGFTRAWYQWDAFELNYGTVAPVVSAFFRKGEACVASYPRDRETEKELMAYIARSLGVESRIHRTIDALVAEDRPILVWGVGAHTQRLLITSRLRNTRISGFVDSDPHYQGKELLGLPIIAPVDVKMRPEPILISSRVFQREIVQQIRGELGCDNELILLYQNL